MIKTNKTIISKDYDIISSLVYRDADYMNMRDRRSRLIDMRNKRIYQFYHRLRRIRKEVRKKYHADLFCYAYYKPDENMDMDEFLKLRDEANKLFNIIYIIRSIRDV